MAFQTADRLARASADTGLDTLSSTVGTVISFDAGKRQDRLERVAKLLEDIAAARREAREERAESTEAREVADDIAEKARIAADHAAEEEEQAIDAERKLEDLIAQLAAIDSGAADRERAK